MRWKRKKPLWPILIAMGGLFLLALAAPLYWQGIECPVPANTEEFLVSPADLQSIAAVRSSNSGESAEVIVIEPVAKSALEAAGPTLPPLAGNSRPPGKAPPQASSNKRQASSAGESAAFEDHFVFDSFSEIPPLVDCFESSSQVAEEDLPEEFVSWQASRAAAQDDADLPAEQDTLPTPRHFDLQGLLQLRDSVQRVMDHLPKLQVPESSAGRQVRVSSEADRLAMRDKRENAPTRTVAEKNRARLPWKASKQPTASNNPLRKQTERVAHNRHIGPIKLSSDAEPNQARQQKPPTTERSKPLAPALRHVPEVLWKRLEAIPPTSAAGTWAREVSQRIEQLTTPRETPLGNIDRLLKELESLRTEGTEQALQEHDHQIQHRWLQAIHALDRRLPLWNVLLSEEMITLGPTPETIPRPTNTMMPLIGEIAQRLEGNRHGPGWRDYLLLDSVAALSSVGTGFDRSGRAELAHEILARMTDTRLTAAQRAFIAQPPVAEYQAELKHWAALAVNLDTLSAIVERYESTGASRYAAAIAEAQQRMQWAEKPEISSLAEHLERHYRGTNLRIAVNEQLLNRMLPRPRTVMTPIQDQVAGTHVRGRARTTTDLAVQLIPDPERLRLVLAASGRIRSDTQSETWPARTRNAGTMYFHARKTVVIDGRGLHVSRTRATVKGKNDLVDVESELDPVPLLGDLLRDLARRKHRSARRRAIHETKAKIAQQARQRMDFQTERRLQAMEDQFYRKVLHPLEKIALLAEPTKFYTTRERAVMHLRLANHDQLAAHSPRPAAPSDSLVSLQFHESGMNNALAGLELDGKRMTVGAVYDFFASQLGLEEVSRPDDLPESVTIEFAPADAVRITCRGDRLQLVLGIQELARGRDKIQNFKVHAFFRPIVDGMNVRLVRDGTLQFEGRHLKTGHRIVLHSALGKLLHKDHQVCLMESSEQLDPRLSGLMITQLVIDDGWIALALGPHHPERTAWRTPVSGVGGELVRQ